MEYGAPSGRKPDTGPASYTAHLASYYGEEIAFVATGCKDPKCAAQVRERIAKIRDRCMELYDMGGLEAERYIDIYKRYNTMYNDVSVKRMRHVLQTVG